MKRSKVNLPVSKWGTIKSKYQPESNYVTNDEFTSGSSNFITNVSGAIEKRPTDILYNSTPLPFPGQDQFEAIFANGVHHLLFMDHGSLMYTSGDTITHTVATGYAANANMEYIMYQNRVYFSNGINNPGVYDLTTSYGGVSYVTPLVKDMGAQVPISAPTFAADTSGGAVPVGGHFYKVTYLYYGFEESNGSISSALHTVSSPNQIVNLTAIPVGGYGVTARKIYRDNNDGNFLLVATILDNTTTTFADSVSTGTTPIPTSNNFPPNFTFIVLNLSRLWIAGVSGTPTTLYWSSPGLPDIFDPNNFIICNPKDPITGLAVYQGVVYVFNRHSFGQILGNTDDTFYYQEFPGSVGCTDNRSIQIRTINGVPILVWLSDRGFYACNGSSVEYISDPIEDEVNLNIQQVNFVLGSNNQSTLADFLGGTASTSIDLATNPGEISTINPTVTFQSDFDWNNGSYLTDAQTLDGLNTLKTIPSFTPPFSSGTLSGQALISGGNLELSTYPDFTGQDTVIPESGYYIGNTLTTAIFKSAVSFSTPRACTLTSLQFAMAWRLVQGENTFYVTIRAGGTTPGAILYQSALLSPASFSHIYNANGFSVRLITDSPAFSLAAGSYWICVEDSNSTHYVSLGVGATTFASNSKATYSSGTWSVSGASMSFGSPLFQSFYHIALTPVPSSGSWVSPIYDSKSVSMTDSLLDIISVLTGSQTADLLVEATNDNLFLTGISSYTFSLPNGGLGDLSSGINHLRYWRLTVTLNTTDDRSTPVESGLTLDFPATAVWFSNTIDCSADVTSYTSFTFVQIGGGTPSVQFASSPDGFIWSAYGIIGVVPVQRYVKLFVAVNPGTAISSVTFQWAVTGTFTSSIINVGQTPAGWGLFQYAAALNGGAVSFFMRSAASAGAIPAATYYPVSNGAFPPAGVLPLQYVEWKILISSTANQLPTVDSITVNWFLGNNQSPIRVASLFFNKTYYLAAAETGQTVNNVVIVWDQEGNWRLFRGININSLGLFFNQSFYIDAVRPNIYQWLIAPDGTGAGINMDVRTKAFDLGDYDHLKNPRSLRVMGINTGTTIHAYFSVDRGQTWIEMLNVNGVIGYTTTTDGSKFYQYFVPNYDISQVVAGVTIMFRVTSTDAFPCKILALEPELTVRSGKYLGEAL